MDRTSLITAARVVTATRSYAPGWVLIRGELVLECGEGQPPAVPASVTDMGQSTIVPGFVDMHVHGGGGGTFAGTDRAAALIARAAHLERGTTTTMASLVTQTPAQLLAAVMMNAQLCREGHVRGIHLEGPWISPQRKGAHPLELLRDPDLEEIDALIEAGDGYLKMVTMAPERAGAIAAIERFVDAGVVVAVGHTDADYATTERAIDAGATVATHLFNAMRPLGHREPGPILALARDPRVTLELIGDGVHVHPDLVDYSRCVAGRDRTVFVTDAMAAACCDDGDYVLGALPVEVVGGVAHIAGTDTIAGSTTTMEANFRAALRPGFAGQNGARPASRDESPGAVKCDPLQVPDDIVIGAVRACATLPAAAMGWDEAGDLSAGKAANMAVLNAAGEVTKVILAGRAL
ncbi:N-acetylglucosamine-6-phosphate deacetylase [Rarobacter incanus]|uniref:N-acetylglucosamine 6-phosphate deacetylase n=1 Tax=Rarobacter incanus TaxID=153494 RepID=A0A542SRM9_9MICO|nr:amidohydrolase family protein [Rarobacter incanus]TQK77255.1 N-acetylglucosamine 6-phosphate deacetylase [Rarobacter incanus]